MSDICYSLNRPRCVCYVRSRAAERGEEHITTNGAGSSHVCVWSPGAHVGRAVYGLTFERRLLLLLLLVQLFLKTGVSFICICILKTMHCSVADRPTYYFLVARHIPFALFPSQAHRTLNCIVLSEYQSNIVPYPSITQWLRGGK
jgi:hypothetical protein